MTKLADPSTEVTASGAEFNLRWSQDESVATLFIYRSQLGNMREQSAKITLTPTQLDELRAFIMDNID
jgi:hypothetical protein